MGYSSRVEHDDFMVEFKELRVVEFAVGHTEWQCTIQSLNDEASQHPHFYAQVQDWDKRTAFNNAKSKIDEDVKQWMDNIIVDLKHLIGEVERNELWPENKPLTKKKLAKRTEVE